MHLDFMESAFRRICMSSIIPNLGQDIHLGGRETVCLQSAFVSNPVFQNRRSLCCDPASVSCIIRIVDVTSQICQLYLIS